MPELRVSYASFILNREKYGPEVPVSYEFKTRLLERSKVIRHSSRASLEAVRGDIGMSSLLLVDQRPNY